MTSIVMDTENKYILPWYIKYRIRHLDQILFDPHRLFDFHRATAMTLECSGSALNFIYHNIICSIFVSCRVSVCFF